MQHGMRFLVPVVLALVFASCSADSGDEGGGGSGGSTNTTRTGGSGAAAGRGGSSGGSSSSGGSGGSSSEGGSGGSESGSGGSGGSGAATDGGAYAEAGSPPTKLNPTNLATPPAVTQPFSLIDGDGNVWWLEPPQTSGF
jgi:hypothetical protein